MSKTCIAIRNVFKDISPGFCSFWDFLQFIACFLQAMRFSTTLQGLHLMKDLMYTIWYCTLYWCFTMFMCESRTFELLWTIYAVFSIDEFYSSPILTFPHIKWFTVKSTKPNLVTPNLVTIPTSPLWYSDPPTLLTIRLQRVCSEWFRRIFITWYFKKRMNMNIMNMIGFWKGGRKFLKMSKLSPNILSEAVIKRCSTK